MYTKVDWKTNCFHGKCKQEKKLLIPQGFLRGVEQNMLLNTLTFTLFFFLNICLTIQGVSDITPLKHFNIKFVKSSVFSVKIREQNKERQKREKKKERKKERKKEEKWAKPPEWKVISKQKKNILFSLSAKNGMFFGYFCLTTYMGSIPSTFHEQFLYWTFLGFLVHGTWRKCAKLLQQVHLHTNQK